MQFYAQAQKVAGDNLTKAADLNLALELIPQGSVSAREFDEFAKVCFIPVGNSTLSPSQLRVSSSHNMEPFLYSIPRYARSFESLLQLLGAQQTISASTLARALVRGSLIIGDRRLTPSEAARTIELLEQFATLYEDEIRRGLAVERKSEDALYGLLVLNEEDRLVPRNQCCYNDSPRLSRALAKLDQRAATDERARRLRMRFTHSTASPRMSAQLCSRLSLKLLSSYYKEIAIDDKALLQQLEDETLLAVPRSSIPNPVSSGVSLDQIARIIKSKAFAGVVSAVLDDAAVRTGMFDMRLLLPNHLTIWRAMQGISFVPSKAGKAVPTLVHGTVRSTISTGQSDLPGLALESYVFFNSQAQQFHVMVRDTPTELSSIVESQVVAVLAKELLVRIIKPLLQSHRITVPVEDTSALSYIMTHPIALLSTGETLESHHGYYPLLESLDIHLSDPMSLLRGVPGARVSPTDVQSLTLDPYRTYYPGEIVAVHRGLLESTCQGSAEPSDPTNEFVFARVISPDPREVYGDIATLDLQFITNLGHMENRREAQDGGEEGYLANHRTDFGASSTDGDDEAASPEFSVLRVSSVSIFGFAFADARVNRNDVLAKLRFIREQARQYEASLARGLLPGDMVVEATTRSQIATPPTAKGTLSTQTAMEHRQTIQTSLEVEDDDEREQKETRLAQSHMLSEVVKQMQGLCARLGINPGSGAGGALLSPDTLPFLDQILDLKREVERQAIELRAARAERAKTLTVIEEIRKSVQCTICMTNTTDVAMQPCGHRICQQCFGQLHARGDARKCPFCRATVHAAARVFLADLEEAFQ